MVCDAISSIDLFHDAAPIWWNVHQSPVMRVQLGRKQLPKHRRTYVDSTFQNHQLFRDKPDIRCHAAETAGSWNQMVENVACTAGMVST
jgi:hypothetical protein